MYTRLVSALALMVLVSAVGTAVAKTQPASGNAWAIPDQHSHDQGDDQSNNNQGVNDQGDDNGQHKDRGHHYGESTSHGDDQDDQGDDKGKHKDRGHHHGKSGAGIGEQGEQNGKGPSRGTTGIVISVPAGSPSSGGTSSSAGSSVSVPEPATVALLVLGLLGCAVRARRR